jgi:Raf kinase inhibitor-like YbhB/YbcL family protein
MKKYFYLVTVLVIVLLLSACTPGTAEPASTVIPPTATEAVTLEISSPAFAEGEAIPVAFSCDGENTSPQLIWNEPPVGTQSFVLIMDDPDAGGTWVHWVVYNLPTSSRGLEAAIPADTEIEGGGLQGRNSSRINGYQGPCPPSGAHHYHFKLYALDTMLDLPAGAHNVEVDIKMKDHVLASAELIAVFSR